MWLQEKAGRKPAWLFAVAATVLVLGIAAAVSSFPPVDLQVYRFGADTVARGGDLYGALPTTTAGSMLPFIYPPFAALLFSALAFPPLSVATVLLDVLSVASLWAVLYTTIRRLWRGWNRRTAVVAASAFTVVAFAFEPVRSTVGFGQINLVLMALVAVDCLAPSTRWPRGVLVGLAAAIKVTPAGFLLFFLLTKDFRAARNVLLTGAGATLLGFLIAPRASAEYFFGGGLTSADGFSGSPYATNQTIEGALNRLALRPDAYDLLWVTLSAFVLVAAVLVMRRVDGSLAFVVNAAAVLLLSPISWSHHWVWVVPATLVLASRVRTRCAAVALVAGAAVFIAAPHTFVPSSGMRELAWDPWQHLVGDSYVILALGFLAWQLVASTLRQNTRPPGLSGSFPRQGHQIPSG
ncbi:glycosyltransferase 87 family protein [Amycolatopsis orientalis]|uniref:glycosyltransferase 87 family protein n=1 Tax=Amycolatopsis orientalis TaxID=31958 RepID=UPI0009DC0827|nr:glycosyltransferase 87 family protein [Amycolatopsis orientalis]